MHVFGYMYRVWDIAARYVRAHIDIRISNNSFLLCCCCLPQRYSPQRVQCRYRLSGVQYRILSAFFILHEHARLFFKSNLPVGLLPRNPHFPTARSAQGRKRRVPHRGSLP